MERYDDAPTPDRLSGNTTPHARRNRRVLAWTAAAVLAGAGIGALGQPSAALGASDAERVVQLVNAERAKAGCAALTVDGRVQSAAQAHADDMAARNYYEHNSPEGKTGGDRLTAAGYSWQKWGENIHKGPSNADRAMRDWMDSGAHRANIVDCSFQVIGVGVNKNSRGPLWVQDFAVAR
ncbi:CAP domain-containing protein [Saccharothrix obliqua]|uniref:CAP domain-containing protein n=1 Tax=Saccharothrix obliqua TaxID=2861747 RepID=UPI001C5E3A92|nr:CAP domain-containing protein [Saccharothrix obliqua]MBW4718597.1 CAP domain-containing protein [Saccharothrix obliqua]